MALRLAPLELASLGELLVDAFVVFVAEDERPLVGLAGLLDWRLAGALTRLLEAEALTGRLTEALLTVTNGRLAAPRILAFGVGPLEGAATCFAEVAPRAVSAIEAAGLGSVAVGLPEVPRPNVSARMVVDSFARFTGEVLLLGDLKELGLALPQAAKRG